MRTQVRKEVGFNMLTWGPAPHLKTPLLKVETAALQSAPILWPMYHQVPSFRAVSRLYSHSESSHMIHAHACHLDDGIYPARHVRNSARHSVAPRIEYNANCIT
jgi:hypothetical protein